MAMAIEGRDGDDWILRAELPGLDPGSDIDISITHHVLHVRAQHAPGPEPGGHPSDFYFGSFARDIALPPDVCDDRVTAVYSGDVLEVRAPIGQAAKVIERQVPVAGGT